jgi:hypothetical protein
MTRRTSGGKARNGVNYSECARQVSPSPGSGFPGRREGIQGRGGRLLILQELLVPEFGRRARQLEDAAALALGGFAQCIAVRAQ